MGSRRARGVGVLLLFVLLLLLASTPVHVAQLQTACNGSDCCSGQLTDAEVATQTARAVIQNG